MEFDISKVRFSKKDILKKIKIPENLTEDLAEDIGIHQGDGLLYFGKTSFEFSYSGNILEKEYMTHIIELKKKLYNLDYVKEYVFGNELRIKFNSLAISTFYSEVIGFPVGTKRDFDIPNIIKNCEDSNMIAAYLRGIIDTDFSLMVGLRQGKNYPRLVGKFASRNLVISLKDLFERLKIDSCIELDIKSIHCKSKKTYVENRITINGYKRVNLWLQSIGYRNVTKFKNKIEKIK